MTAPGGEGPPPDPRTAFGGLGPEDPAQPYPRFEMIDLGPDEPIPRYTGDPWEDEPVTHFVGRATVDPGGRGPRRPRGRGAPVDELGDEFPEFTEDELLGDPRPRRRATGRTGPTGGETLTETLERRVLRRDAARVLRVGVDPETGERLSAEDRAELEALLNNRNGPLAEQLSRNIPSTYRLPNRRLSQRIGYSPARGFQRARRRVGEMLTEWPRSLVGTLGVIAVAGMAYAQARYGSADMSMAAADLAQHVTPVAEEGTRSVSAGTDSFVELVRSSVDKVPVVGGVASPLAELATTVAIEAPIDMAAGAVREVMPNSAQEMLSNMGRLALVGGVMIFDTPRRIVRENTQWVADRAQRGVNTGSHYAVRGLDIAGRWTQNALNVAARNTGRFIFGTLRTPDTPATVDTPRRPGNPGNIIPRAVTENFRRVGDTLYDSTSTLPQKIGSILLRGGLGVVLLGAVSAPIIVTRGIARPFLRGAREIREFREERAGR